MGCPIRKSRDQYSLAVPPSLSQLATSFIACDAKVSTCALLCTLHTRHRLFGQPMTSLSFLEIASARARKYAHVPLSCLTHESSSLCSFQRSEGRDSPSRSIAIQGTRIELGGRSLKAEQYSLGAAFCSAHRRSPAHVLTYASPTLSSIRTKNPHQPWVVL